MSTLLARCLGLVGRAAPAPDAMTTVIARELSLCRAEARIVLLDYLGYTRHQILDELQINPGSLRKYWQRINKKTGCTSRAEIRQLLEISLAAALRDEPGAQ